MKKPVDQILAWTFITAMCSLTPAANAHHSLSIFSDQTIELEGEITDIRWQNPHVMIELRTTGADGSSTWRMEGGSVTTLQRSGVTSDMLRPGDHVRVAGFPSRRDSLMLGLTNVLLPDGREVQFRTGTPPRFTGVEGMVRGADAVVDAEQENRGIFRVWSVPAPNPATAALRDLPYKPEAIAARASFDLFDNFATRCEPEGMPRIMLNPHPFEFVDRGDTLLLRTELYDIERTIHMNHTGAPPDEPHSRLGYSIGRWDGGELVITTTHIDWPYFDNAGTPQSTNVIVAERYRLSDDQTRLSFTMTVTDPDTFSAPAVISGHWLALGHSIDRYDCGSAR